MIPFSIKKFSTGRYKVVTRSGEPVFIENILPGGWIEANIPTVKDCRGNTRYGFTRDGKVRATGEDPLDLMLVKKSGIGRYKDTRVVARIV